MQNTNGGGLFNALLQRATGAPNGAPPQPSMPPQAQGTPNGVPFGGTPNGGPNGGPPPSPAQGLWSKLPNRNTSQPPVQNGQAAPQQPIAGPAGPAMPPSPPSRVPPAVERFTNGQQIQQAYANGWQPNPVLLRAMLGR